MKGIISLLFPNKKNFEEFLNRANYKIIYLIPIILGLTLGIMRTEIKYKWLVDSYIIGVMTFEIIKIIAIVFILSYIYAWVTYFLSNMLQGKASIKLIFMTIFCSLLPMMLGSIVILIFNLVAYHVTDNWILFVITIILQLWAVYILWVGNSVINNFSYLKSFISSSIIIILAVIVQVLQVVK